jgi:glycosyltransferase involved in cell wall biosynthesis
MSEAGLNTVRTYTVPPPDVVEVAEEAGLRLIVGLHYDDWRMIAGTGRRAHRRVLDSGRRALDAAMGQLAGRPSVLALSVGNEVPADLVRLHGAAAVEDTLSALVQEVHAADDGMLATYTNYPTTEYLEVFDQDLASFNVFLESPQALSAYLRHLQVVCGHLPVVITELGLAGDVHGDVAQRETLEWQLRTVDESGCAGASVFSWTDEWAVGGEPVEGWGFGITRADRRPKPAFQTVASWARSSIADRLSKWPRISVVVCAHNGDQLIEKCLTSLRSCGYPDLEVIVCDDGSTDRTLEIARSFRCLVLELPRLGLGAARNAGLAAATGEIVAFIDADAFCHPDWPYYLAISLEDDGVVATGGPNLPVSGAALVERAVSRSPGAPMEVLLADDRAEHVPGCNMAFRREALREVGGFDTVFTAAGDDVDVCWRLLDRGYVIGFAPAAQVRHHRRDRIGRYLRQQLGYGRAERLLRGLHPHRFNRRGQARWSGFIYGGVGILHRVLRPVVYHGDMGQAPFQTVLRSRPEAALQLASALLPGIVGLFLVALLGASLSPLWLAGGAASLAAVAAYAAAVALAVRPTRHEEGSVRLRLLVALLHVVQPLVRTGGRLRGRRPRAVGRPPQPWTGVREIWLAHAERHLQGGRCVVRRAGPYHATDLEVSVGPLVRGRLTAAVLWRAVPLHRLTFRLRAPALVGLALGLGVASSAPPGGAILCVAVVAGALLELLVIRRIVGASIRATTQGAPPWPPRRHDAARFSNRGSNTSR